MPFSLRPQQVIYNSVVDRLGALLKADEPNQLEIKMLERDAKRLLETSQPVMGWIALVGIAAVQWDEAEAMQLAQNAVKLFGEDGFLVSNLAVAFRQLDMLEEALRYSRSAHACDPLNWEIAEEHVGDLGNLGSFQEAREVLQTYIGRAGEQLDADHAAHNYFRLTGMCLEAIDEADIDIRELRLEIISAADILREKRIRLGGVHYLAEKHPEGDVTLVVNVEVPGTFDDELRLGALLAPRLARLPNWNPAKLLLDFTTIEAQTAHDAEAHADVVV